MKGMLKMVAEEFNSEKKTDCVDGKLSHIRKMLCKIKAIIVKQNE